MIRNLSNLIKVANNRNAYILSNYRGKDWGELVKFTDKINSIPISKTLHIKCWPIASKIPARELGDCMLILEGQIMEYIIHTVDRKFLEPLYHSQEILHQSGLCEIKPLNQVFMARKPSVTLHI